MVKESRYKIVRVGYPELFHIMNGSKLMDLPKNSEIVTIRENYRFHALDIVVWNPSFEITCPGDKLPVLEITLTDVKKYWREYYINAKPMKENKEKPCGGKTEGQFGDI